MAGLDPAIQFLIRHHRAFLTSSWPGFPHFVMAGLVPAIHALQTTLMGWIYILTNRPDGTLYVGVTNNLIRRIHEHRSGNVPGFTKRYGLNRLVYFEIYATMPLAIQREKNIKHWSRAWKARLINEYNRDWSDLYDELI